jgi:hypothetical protein
MSNVLGETIMSQAHVEPDRKSTSSMPPRTPRWVKIFAIITIILILLLVVLTLIDGGGGHGPGRHTSPSDAGGDTAPVSVTEDQPASTGGHTPPIEHGGQ